MSAAPDLVWGVEASPFLLKLEAMLRFHGRPFRRLPAQGEWLENLRTVYRIEAAKRAGSVLRYPGMDADLDEYPSVPFFSEDGAQFHYDTSALGHWLDDQSTSDGPLLFPRDPVLAFVAQLLDEAFDEFGLYMVHHMRWVGSVSDTRMGEHTAQEMSRLVTPLLAPLVRKFLPRRQVRRCPYLFSVAPENFAAAVEPSRVPPSRRGFPPTHALLDSAWRTYVDAMELLLGAQPFILGDRFSIADASAYGQLSMNLIDPSTEKVLRASAPRLHAWLIAIRDGEHLGREGHLYLSEYAKPLLSIVMRSFVELMAQNEVAWRLARKRAETCFNEAAFDRGAALYDGVLLGHPFRSVAKSFQVRVWREICESWSRLPETERVGLRGVLPGYQRFEQP
jgi:hypothetical protein